MSTYTALATGFALQGALIVAIGAQNVFVLRQGLRREHVGVVVAFCVGADLALTTAGTNGIGLAIGRAPGLVHALTFGGAVFLAWYGLGAARRALNPGRLIATDAGGRLSRRAVLCRASAFTLLNPGVWIDAVLLVGASGAGHPAAERPMFLVGVGLASLLWFAGLGYGARLLAPLFARPAAWRWLDGVVAAVMLLLAAALVGHAAARPSAELIEPAHEGFAAVMGLGHADVVQGIGVGNVAQHRPGHVPDLCQAAELVPCRQQHRRARRAPPDRDLVEHQGFGRRRDPSVNAAGSRPIEKTAASASIPSSLLRVEDDFELIPILRDGYGTGL